MVVAMVYHKNLAYFFFLSLLFYFLIIMALSQSKIGLGEKQDLPVVHLKCDFYVSLLQIFGKWKCLLDLLYCFSSERTVAFYYRLLKYRA